MSHHSPIISQKEKKHPADLHSTGLCPRLRTGTREGRAGSLGFEPWKVEWLEDVGFDPKNLEKTIAGWWFEPL